MNIAQSIINGPLNACNIFRAVLQFVRAQSRRRSKAVAFHNPITKQLLLVALNVQEARRTSSETVANNRERKVFQLVLFVKQLDYFVARVRPDTVCHLSHSLVGLATTKVACKYDEKIEKVSKKRWNPRLINSDP
jgi:hypothetical protein